MTANRKLGVCSWSLQAEDPRSLAERVRACDLSFVQLALDPIISGAWPHGETRRILDDSGIGLLSGMMAMKGEDYATLASIRATGGLRPDPTWPANADAARRGADAASRLGIDIVTFHAGFVPHDPEHPERAVMLDRLAAIRAIFADEGVSLGLETGQESADTLLALLDDLGTPPIGVNFDPANMILYGMGDPVDAVRQLSHRIVQCHVKDALPAEHPGAWGTEVPVGAGSVDWRAFMDALDDAAPACALVIEREAGDRRIEDVRTAVSHLSAVAGRGGADS